MNLYSTHASEFSNTRVKPWEGWLKIVESLPKNERVKILDLGCGNGRFLKFLVGLNKYKSINYLGIDNSPELLAIAEKDTSDLKRVEGIIEFKNADLSKNDWVDDLDGKYDLIVCFGVMHHIEKYEQRVEIIMNSYNLLNSKGKLVLTFWQFADNSEFLSKHKIDRLNAILDDNKFSEHNYQLSFGKNGAERFAHHFTEQEIESLVTDAEVAILEKFQADGRDNKMNCYVIIEKSDSI